LYSPVIPSSGDDIQVSSGTLALAYMLPPFMAHGWIYTS
jgi:hypothetical protein